MPLFKPNIQKMAQKKDLIGLGKALMDKDETIRQEAAAVFDQIGLPDDPTVQAWHAIIKQDWERVRTFGKHAIPPLSATLHGPDDMMKLPAATALIDIDLPEGTAEIVDAVKTFDEGLRMLVIANVTLAGKGRQVADGVTPFLNSKDEKITKNAQAILEQIGSLSVDDIIPALTNMIKHYDEKSRGVSTACAILIRFGGPKIVDAFIDLLHEPDIQAKDLAIYSLGKLGDPRAIGPLAEIVNDLTLDVKIPEDVIRAVVLNTTRNPRVFAVNALKTFGKAAVDILEAAHDHEDPEVILAASLAVSDIRNDSQE